MKETQKRFTISFRTLLADMARNLGWSTPLYRCLDPVAKMAFVVIYHSCFSESYFFKGQSSLTMMESEENAAEQAVHFIVVKERILIDDFNYLAKEKYKKVAAYYCNKTLFLKRLLNGKEEEGEASGVEMEVTLYSQVISIDFDSLLGDVINYYEMARTEPVQKEMVAGEYVVSFALYHIGSDHLIDWIIGEPSLSAVSAKQNTAKKASVFIQSMKDFEVKDGNYTEMKIVKTLCDIEQEIYLITKDRASVKCSTPKSSGSKIPKLVGPPPLPTKAKRKNVSDGSESSRITKSLSILDDLIEVFKRNKEPFC